MGDWLKITYKISKYFIDQTYVYNIHFCTLIRRLLIFETIHLS